MRFFNNSGVYLTTSFLLLESVDDLLDTVFEEKVDKTYDGVRDVVLDSSVEDTTSSSTGLNGFFNSLMPP